jgi:Domain of unknown function (DUF305)
MTGRIKILKDGVPVSAANEPPLPYNYDTTSEFDATCGTHGLDLYQLPNSQCPEQFVCTAEDVTPEFQQFASCIDAMNCHMMAGMTSGSSAQSPTALFLHQMIPHHQNAVNMAKTLMNYKGEILCDDLTNDADPICVMEAVLRDIINTQNYQIQQMKGILESMNYNSTDDCSVTITTEREIIEGSAPTPSTTTASAPTPSGTSGAMALPSFIAMSSATMLVLASLVL